MTLNILGRKQRPAVIGADIAATNAPREPKLKKSNAINPDDDKAVGAWYLAQSKEFERNKRERERTAAKAAYFFAGGALVVAAISVIGAIGLAVLKRPNPPAVLRVDNATGAITVLPTTANGHVSWDEKNDRADLHRYVEARESYDWETINDEHDFVMLETDGKEADLYDAFIRGPRGPLTMLKDQFRVIAKAGVITFVGDTAQVFFSKQLVPLSAGTTQPQPEYWIATISYKHVSVAETSDKQDLDPDGFRVASYRVDRDWSRTNQAGAK